MKCKLAVVTEDVVAQSKKFSDEDHQRECKKLEAKNDELKKTINNMKQVGFLKTIPSSQNILRIIRIIARWVIFSYLARLQREQLIVNCIL